MSNYTKEQVIKAKSHFKHGVDYDIFSEPVLTYAKIALEAIEYYFEDNENLEDESCESVDITVDVSEERARLQQYVKRIIASVNYKGTADHEDVPSILREFEEENLYLLNQEECEKQLLNAKIEKLTDEREYLLSMLGAAQGKEYLSLIHIPKEDFILLSKDSNGYKKLKKYLESEALKQLADKIKSELDIVLNELEGEN